MSASPAPHADLPVPPVPGRDRSGHKGTFGTVGVLGGCAGPGVRMIGAPALAGLGALRAGCGLVRLAVPAPILDSALAMLPSATGLAVGVDGAGGVPAHEASASVDTLVESCDCLVVGPGLGMGPGARSAAVRAIQQEERPVVIDADAINALAQVPDLTRDWRGACVLTPHPGEFRRLAAPLRISGDPSRDESRPAACAAMAQKLGCVVVLKGAGTVVSDGQRTWVCGSGHPCLATAGSGDVLAGIIAGLVAQFAVPARSAGGPGRAGGAGGAPVAGPSGLDLFDAARVGVLAHALAGERWAAARGASGGALAAEIAGEIPAVLEGLRGTGVRGA